MAQRIDLSGVSTTRKRRSLDERSSYGSIAAAMCMTRLRGHGSGSGAPIEQTLFQVFALRRGRIVDQVDYWDREEALAALEA